MVAAEQAFSFFSFLSLSFKKNRIQSVALAMWWLVSMFQSDWAEFVEAQVNIPI